MLFCGSTGTLRAALFANGVCSIGITSSVSRPRVSSIGRILLLLFLSLLSNSGCLLCDLSVCQITIWKPRPSPTCANLVRSDRVSAVVGLINGSLRNLVGKSKFVQLEYEQVGNLGNDR